MAFEEKRSWIMVLVAITSYAVYLAVVISGQPAGVPLSQAHYAAVLLWTIGASIAASIVLHILVSIVSPEGANQKDQRDREIHIFGTYVGQSFLVIGGVAGLILSIARFDQFWIGNAIYLGFVLSAVLSSVTKIVAYRWGLGQW